MAGRPGSGVGRAPGARARTGCRSSSWPTGHLAEQDAALDALEAEVVRTSERLGQAASINIGIRRASGPTIVVLDTSVEPTGDVVTPLVAALEDPTVAVAGGWGLVSDDLRKFREAPAGDVDAVEGYAMAFRRDDAIARGPLDERFRFYRNLDIWWSLVLRDEGEEQPPRRAVTVDAAGQPPRAPWLDEPPR